MRHMKLNSITRLFVLLAVAVLALSSTPDARANDREPDLPTPLCSRVAAPEGNKVAFHVYAVGVQIYKWNGATWSFVAPMARLYADANHLGEVGFHYAGPAWESNSGSKVVARRLEGCTPDSTAIPWLLLETVTANGPGIFHSTTFIQRVNTTGGLAPTAPGSTVDELIEVPYTAEYYFYRAAN